MAPEGHLTNKLDFKSDIFSIGIIIFQLQTNQHPFDAPSEAEIIEKIKKGDMIRLPGWVSRKLKEIIESMLSADASKRPTTEQIMEQETIKIYLKMQEDIEKMKLEFEKMKSEMAKMQQTQSEPKEQTKPSPKAEVISTPKPKQITQTNVVVPPQLMSINPQPIIPNAQRCRYEGMKIIHSEEDNTYGFAIYDPIIVKGIMIFEGLFENYATNLYIGIADSSAVFGKYESPWQKHISKTITYISHNGGLRHINKDGIEGNARFEDNQKIAMEVNMDSTPRTLHFFVEGKQQPLSIINIPASVRFWICSLGSNSSFTLTQFQSRSSSSAKGVEGSKTLDWGKESDWKKK